MTKKVKIVMTDVPKWAISIEARDLLKNLGQVVWMSYKDGEQLIKQIQDAEVIVTVGRAVISRRVMNAGQFIKGVVVFGAGFENVDVDAAIEKGILVTNTSGSNAEAVAEHVFSLILNLIRKTHLADAFVKKRKWKKPKLEFKGRELLGKTIGIIGFGQIGSRVARIAGGFNMRILAHDPYISSKKIKDAGAQPASIEVVLKESDFLTLHVPLNPETKGMIGEKEISLMKSDAYLINTSRGPVIDEKALIKALKEKRIAGAGLDVYIAEPIPLDNPILNLDNVVLTPHIAFFTEVSIRTTSIEGAEEVARILRGEIPKNLINKDVLIKRKLQVDHVVGSGYQEWKNS